MAALRRFEMLIRATDMMFYRKNIPTNVYFCESQRTGNIQDAALCNEDYDPYKKRDIVPVETVLYCTLFQT